jgi:predicted nucleic acid-binding protein
VLLDTTFLIDLQRELRGKRPDDAIAFLKSQSTSSVCISLITWMEFAEGYGDAHEQACRQFLSRFPLVLPDVPIAWQASRLSRFLRAQGRRIGDHDLWIAATALELRVPLVTRNSSHFRPVPGLNLMSY